MVFSLFAEASVRRRGERLVITGPHWRGHAARVRDILDDLGLERVSIYRFGPSLLIFAATADDRQRIRNAFAAARL
jgi:hypothetical protein